MTSLPLRQKSRYASLSLDEALSKLREASETIEAREGVEQHEGRRIQEALRLITKASAPSDSKTTERQESYQVFLKRVRKVCGFEMVILCAIGLGKSAVAAMKDTVRLRLPSRIRLVEGTLNCSILSKLVEEHSSPVPEDTHTALETQPPVPNAIQSVQQIDSFAGRVFQLTIDDARAITMSDQVKGGVWLTDPWNGTSLPFITIPISQELSRQYAIRRPQAM